MFATTSILEGRRAYEGDGKLYRPGRTPGPILETAYWCGISESRAEAEGKQIQ
jgi:hypothetical protein